MRRLWKAGELFLCALQGRRVDLVVFGREPPTREHPAGFSSYPGARSTFHVTKPTSPATRQGARATYPVPQTRLPYTSSNFKRPPRLGERSQRGVPYTVVIVSSRRVDWCPPIGGWGHGWRDARVGSTSSKIQLMIA